ncbi:DRMBL-domain-containing protein [Decorospora gaudefroyi]|uniref:DRMBL-domain-containing protein n=1 Tax=Decorospora gaudefroyi TaxID=184978 RepID=A0A6A5KNI5_9PLEO|nr:DRMBL-domain-containing protein [Decorospora gaudefroyi]
MLPWNKAKNKLGAVHAISVGSRGGVQHVDPTYASVEEPDSPPSTPQQRNPQPQGQNAFFYGQPSWSPTQTIASVPGQQYLLGTPQQAFQPQTQGYIPVQQPALWSQPQPQPLQHNAAQQCSPPPHVREPPMNGIADAYQNNPNHQYNSWNHYNPPATQGSPGGTPYFTPNGNPSSPPQTPFSPSPSVLDPGLQAQYSPPFTDPASPPHAQWALPQRSAMDFHLYSPELAPVQRSQTLPAQPYPHDCSQNWHRNPRENRTLPASSRLAPSAGRPPSPPRSPSSTPDMAAKPAAKKAAPTPRTKAPPPQKSSIQTTLTASGGVKKSPANNGKKQKPPGTPNGNIKAFFQKAEEINNRIFLQERGSNPTIVLDGHADDEDVGWSDEKSNGVVTSDKGDERYNENGGSSKRRKVDHEALEPLSACSPALLAHEESRAIEGLTINVPRQAPKLRKKSGPFLDDSESEDDDAAPPPTTPGMDTQGKSEQSSVTKPSEDPLPTDSLAPSVAHVLPLLNTETTSQDGAGEFDHFEDLEDDDLLEGEEYDERRWMKAQQQLEMEEAGFEGDPDDFDGPPFLFPDDDTIDTKNEETDTYQAPSCPICGNSLPGLSQQDVSVHVNACLDGNPLPLPTVKFEQDSKLTHVINAKAYQRPSRPAKPGQANPFQLARPNTEPSSAFSKLMAGHAEDSAWATAAAETQKSRGKPAYQRTCPFYKIMPGFFIAVDAFRYGAVKGQNAYFLSHFHSDHYIGLTASWKHGPIYCSKVTGNLVRQQLRVDPKWVVDLDFEKKTEVPGTEGVSVTMISANHCPGSSLFLFEKAVGKGANPRLQRVLHCGDFRACQAHIEHPLLRPDVLDAVSGKNRQQRLDACYLDTTYLNPKYAFPPQQQVIQACADMCVSLSKVRADDADGWEQMKRDRAGEGIVKFVRKDSNSDNATEPKSPGRGRLLVVVGTYSIGKERICTGIAKALNSKIYAPPNKQRICKALEDPELDALLTTNPRAAQVHMTPLFEIRAETLDDYLRDYADTFSRVVGFRPSGWNYRPPKGRFTDSPTVQTVLHSENWKSTFSMKELVPQPGSGTRASCFGVPYSEHSSFRELTMFCCALRIDKIIPTVNVGSAKSREKMKAWCDKWAADKRKNGLFMLGEGGEGW